MTLTRVIGSPSLQYRPDEFSPQLSEVLFIRCNLQAGQKNNLVDQEVPHKSPFGGCAFQLLSAAPQPGDATGETTNG
jgi:hypothetical protein